MSSSFAHRHLLLVSGQASAIGQALLCRMFCQATGFGGTVQEGRTVEDKLRARDENPDEAVEKVRSHHSLSPGALTSAA